MTMKHAHELSGKVAEKGRDLPVITPLTDIYEDAEAIRLEMDMPGVEPDQVEIELEKGVLSITACPLRPAADASLKKVHEECLKGRFERTFHVTAEVDFDQIEARMSDGVLYLTLPRSEKAKARRISVRSS